MSQLPEKIIGGKKNSNKKSTSKRQYLSKTNVKSSITSQDVDLTDDICLNQFGGKVSAGDMQQDRSNLQSDHTDALYWGDDELEPARSDFDILSTRSTRQAHLTEYLGGIGAYCAHCGITPVVGGYSKYCTQCKRNKHEWLPRVPRRKLRRKVYRNAVIPQRARRLSSIRNNKVVKMKLSSVFKSKFKSLVRNTTQPPSQYSNRPIGVRRRCISAISTDTEGESNVLVEKAQAFRTRREDHFYRRHKYQSACSSESEAL